MSLLHRVLGRIVDVRREETVTMLLLFAYSFLAMTAYNIIQPLTRSKLISSLGAVNVPWVIFGSGLLIGVLMLGYTRLVSLLPRRWALPITQAGMAVAMIGFWVLFRTAGEWVSVAFYIWGLILGILLISQFWTLANGLYDPRQAKRLFGFVGGGVMLGGMTGAGLTALIIETVGANTLLLWSAFTLLVCAGIVSVILGREREATASVSAAVDEEKGVSIGRAFALLRESKQIQLIAAVISFGSLGALLIDQQLNMAAEMFKGAGQEDSIGAFLAQVRFYVSVAAFVIQVWVTPRIHRYLGIGFALLILPTSLAMTAAVIIINKVLWAPAVASIVDRSCRYSVDKTTREVLFLPLPSELRQDVKPFVDVTVDRLSRGLGALLMLVLIQPWGLALVWYQLSYVSLALAIAWCFMSLRAKREYLASFRRSIATGLVKADELRLSGSELSTVETLVQELAHPDPARVTYAIDVLESLDKRNLVTPLLLYHEAPKVRRRALSALGAVRSDIAQQWIPQIRRMLGDGDAGVRAAAIGALSAISQEDAASFARPLLADADPRIRATAAVAMAGSSRPEDIDQAEATLLQLVSNTDDASKGARRDVAVAIRQVADPRFRRLLIPLLYDPALEVADEAMESVQASAKDDFIFVPSLVSLLRNRRLKGRARAALVAYGEPVVESLAFFLRDPEEDIWVRRHIPGTLGQIPSQKTVDVLVAALEERDGFIRYKVVSALERLRREHPELTLKGESIEALAIQEARRYFNFLSLHDNLFGKQKLAADSLLAQGLAEQMTRLRNRILKLLTLLYPPADIDAARWTLEHGDTRGRSSASEYLDNILSGPLRKQVLPVLEDMPRDERVRRGNVLIKTRPRDVEETLLQLINDDDPVTAAAAIDVVREQKMWSLADDVEHVLAHRDVKDWYVFEAASWTLAEQRMPAERRRELWLEPLPAAELAGRLRRLPLFASVTVDELFRMASASRQVRHETGSVLTQDGSVPSSIHILLDGRVTASGRDSGASVVDAPAALAFFEAMAGLAMPETMRTTGSAVTLALTVEELRTLLADNTDLVSGLFATLAERSDEPDRAVHPTGAASELAQLADGGLTAIDRVFALQYVPLFRRVSADEMQQLAMVAAPVKITAGSVLFPESAPPALWLLLTGEVALESSTGQPASAARGGDIIGSVNTMAGRSLGRAAKVVAGGIALKIDREDLFDVLAERPDLLRQMFAGMFKRERPLAATR
jgi:ATP/ADP translocase/HEAT repeat protein/CRP-like cAMP-binding protein